MNKYGKILIFTLLLVSFTYCTSAQVEIAREKIFQLPDELANELIGMRVSGSRVFMANAAGRLVRYDLETKESFRGQQTSGKILDFDLVLEQMIVLDATGSVAGRKRQSWPKRTYDATSLEVCSEGLILSGGDQTFYLAKNATQAHAIGALPFAVPIDNGFVWAMHIRPKTGLWGVDLYDVYGNLMKEIYNFSAEFVPAGLEVGPIGPEGELLVSAYENNQRKFSLIASNGHMFWKINAPDRICKRDTGFDAQGNLLVFEKEGDKIWLNRWKLATPEG